MTMGRHVFLGKYGVGPELAYPENWAGKIGNADAVFLSGYTLQESRLTAACLRALEAAREVGVPVFFDPGPEMARAGSDLREQVLALSQVILMTEEEIPLMTGGPGGLEAVPGLLSMGAELACVKRGRDGCVLFRGGERVEHPGYPVEVRDTAAAGDSFDAALIYAYLHGWQMADMAAFANAMGAAKVRKAGSGSQVPTAAEVQAVLDQYHVGLRAIRE